jgi:hypothetical protein
VGGNWRKLKIGLGILYGEPSHEDEGDVQNFKLQITKGCKSIWHKIELGRIDI